MKTTSLAGNRVTVMGLGHFGGGLGAARWLAARGALVTVTDRAPAEVLVRSIALLDDAPIRAFHLGEHVAEDFRDADLVVVNPAVRLDSPFVKIARDAGAVVTTEIGLFLDACPASTVGVTGSNGKSTTAAMIANVLAAEGRRVWLGGNLGGSLLDELDQMAADDWVILEISSFQLVRLPPQTTMPTVAVVTNCTPNHLDWHGDWSSYVAAKQRILQGLPPKRLSQDRRHRVGCPGLSGAKARFAAIWATASLWPRHPRALPPAGSVVLGPSLADDDGWTRLAGDRRAALVAEKGIPPLGVPGIHNRENAVCAATAAAAAGCRAEAIAEGLRSFVPLPGRMERIATLDDREFYNDTAATTPESTIAALGSLDRPIWLVAGGGDKGCDFDRLVAVIAASACGVAFYGELGPRLHDSLARQPKRPPSTCLASMDEALRWCWTQSRPGDAIVLSPAATSHDQFLNFRERGEVFARLVSSLANGDGQERVGWGDSLA
jgi:UDP-N-acetylmuramoylalanine--D-glutamate ligase